MLTPKPRQQSRRDVQRRFPPGTFVIDEWNRKLSLVVGWCPTPPVIVQKTGFDHMRRAKSWVAVTVRDQRVDYVPWETMRGNMTIEEWLAS